MTNLTYLSLGYNELTGEIPEGICELESLSYVSLSNNNLCPPYPGCLSGDQIGSQTPEECSPCIEGEGTLGDINEDSVIDILDIVTGMNIILETISYTDCQSYLLDFNEDGTTDVLDIVEMVNYILPY